MGWEGASLPSAATAKRNFLARADVERQVLDGEVRAILGGLGLVLSAGRFALATIIGVSVTCQHMRLMTFSPLETYP